MKKNIKIIICVIVVLVAGIFIGLNINNSNNSNNNNNEENVVEYQKVASASISINGDESINSKLISTYSELINSNAIKRQVQEKYPNAKSVQLKPDGNSKNINVIYVCEGQNESECIDIVYEYITLLINKTKEVYNIDNIKLIGYPTIVNEEIIK